MVLRSWGPSHLNLSFTSSSPGRSSELPRPEEPYTLSERRSSSDSNKASSGEVSPYDNNSPVLSERRPEPGSPGDVASSGGRIFRAPGQVPGGDTWGAKGERGKNFTGDGLVQLGERSMSHIRPWWVKRNLLPTLFLFPSRWHL